MDGMTSLYCFCYTYRLVTQMLDNTRQISGLTDKHSCVIFDCFNVRGDRHINWISTAATTAADASGMVMLIKTWCLSHVSMMLLLMIVMILLWLLQGEPCNYKDKM